MFVHEINNMSLYLCSSNIYIYRARILSRCTHGVSKKYKYFVSFLTQNCITNKLDPANTLHNL